MNVEIGHFAAQARTERAAFAWQPSRRALRQRLYLSLIVVDILCVLVAFLAARLLYRPAEDDQWLLIASLLVPIYLGVAFNGGAYSVSILQSARDAMSRSAQSMLIAAGALVLLAFYLKASAIFSRATFGIGIAIAIVLLIAARNLFVRYARALLGGNPFSTVVICDGEPPAMSGAFSVVLAAGEMLDPDKQCPEMYDRLAATLRNADRVVVSCAPERRVSWTSLLKGANIQSEILAPELLSIAPFGMARWGGLPTLIVADGPLSRSDELVKRLFDIAVSGAALLALSPLLLFTAIAIRSETAGPVLFVQTRIGRGNRMFRMLKFRSMRAEMCDASGVRSTGRDDDRITRVGRFIRATSIDELPQLINVLRGDMSIVGPRPHALGSRAANKLFWEVDDRYFHRHAAKPGLTGLAQVRGHRGATEHESDLTNRLQADLEYLNDWSIWKDVAIMIRTLRILVHRNAF